MSNYILQPDAGEDFYAYWSTIVDSPIAWGTREQLTKQFGEDAMREERWERAEKFGTSSMIGSHSREEDDTYIMRELFPGEVKVKLTDLRELLESIVFDKEGRSVSWNESLAPAFDLEAEELAWMEARVEREKIAQQKAFAMMGSTDPRLIGEQS